MCGYKTHLDTVINLDILRFIFFVWSRYTDYIVRLKTKKTIVYDNWGGILRTARDNSVVEFSIVAVLMLNKTRVVAGSIPAREKYIIIMLYILIYIQYYIYEKLILNKH